MHIIKYYTLQLVTCSHAAATLWKVTLISVMKGKIRLKSSCEEGADDHQVPPHTHTHTVKMLCFLSMISCLNVMKLDTGLLHIFAVSWLCFSDAVSSEKKFQRDNAPLLKGISLPWNHNGKNILSSLWSLWSDIFYYQLFKRWKDCGSHLIPTFAHSA